MVLVLIYTFFHLFQCAINVEMAETSFINYEKMVETSPNHLKVEDFINSVVPFTDWRGKLSRCKIMFKDDMNISFVSGYFVRKDHYEAMKDDYEGSEFRKYGREIKIELNNNINTDDKLDFFLIVVIVLDDRYSWHLRLVYDTKIGW